MLGAILGDMVGAPYEFDYYNIKTTDFPLLSIDSHFTDDTVMTVAVAHALMDTYGKSDEEVKAAVVERMQQYGKLYPYAGYGEMFSDWLQSSSPQPYNSYGNGSAMRVSSVGWLYFDLEETLHAAKLTAEVTHNHPEGVKGAQAVAAAIFLARSNIDKERIAEYLEGQFGYDLKTPLADIREEYEMDESCQGSVPQAIRAFLEGESYEKVIRLAVSIGGDSDTIACIAGGIAEAFYGLPVDLQEEAMDRLDGELRAQVRRFAVFCEEHKEEEIRRRQDKDIFRVLDEYSPNISGYPPIEKAIEEWYAGGINAAMSPIWEAMAQGIREGVRVLVPIYVPEEIVKQFRTEKLASGIPFIGKENVPIQMKTFSAGRGMHWAVAFTSEEELDKGTPTSRMPMPLKELLENAAQWKTCAGIIINAWGSKMIITKDIIDNILSMAGG